jgi:hypothetical protein
LKHDPFDIHAQVHRGWPNHPARRANAKGNWLTFRHYKMDRLPFRDDPCPYLQTLKHEAFAQGLARGSFAGRAHASAQHCSAQFNPKAALVTLSQVPKSNAVRWSLLQTSSQPYENADDSCKDNNLQDNSEKTSIDMLIDHRHCEGADDNEQSAD